MAIGIDTSNYYRSYSSIGTASSSSSPFDYKAAQKETAAMLENYKQNAAKVKSLKADSADFLDDYTKKMNTMSESADALRGSNLDKLVGDVSSGTISDEALKKVTDAAQKMVSAYNDTLTTLSKNKDRGAGVSAQRDRMTFAPPASSSSMKMVGITVGKDGTLALDTEKLSSAIKNAAAADAKTGSGDRMKLIKDVIGGSSGVATGIKQDATNAKNASASSLISNDLAKMQSTMSENPFQALSMYTRSGAVNMMNMGAVGLLMNVMA